MAGTRPKQERSRKTLERTLDAAERLLDKKPFEAISIEELVEAAGSSVGAFYARFGSKDGLLPKLYERYDADLRNRIETLLANGDWEHRTIEEQTRWYARIHIKRYREHQWLMRAVGWYARRHPSPLPGPMSRARGNLHRRIAESFQPHFHRIPADNPREKVELGLYFISAVCRDKLLFAGPHAAVTKISFKRLETELTRMFLAYLGVQANH